MTRAGLDEPLVQRQTSLGRDAWNILHLSIPMFLSVASFSVMKTTDTALLGHTGTEYLEAVSLSDLWTSSTGVFLQSSAVATLCVQAFGAGNKELVGIWIQVAWSVLIPMSFLVALTWVLTATVLLAAGVRSTLASDAEYFVVVLVLCMPARVAYSQLNQFFQSQKIVKPGARWSLVGMIANLVLGLFFVLGIPFRSYGFLGFGFIACPWVTTAVEYLQLVGFWWDTCRSRRLHTECWPGFSWEHITRARVGEYFSMYIYQSLSLASDFWRVSAIGIIAASAGAQNVAVWNSGYRICWLVLIFSSSVSSAMSILIGQALGANDTKTAKRHAILGVSFVVAAMLVLCCIIVFIPRHLGMIFSSDPVILDIFEHSRVPMAFFVGTMNLSVALEKIPLAVGKPKIAFWLGVVGSWVGQVPGAFICAKFWRDDLIGIYTGASVGYALLCVLLAIANATFDWDQLARDAQSRSQL